MTRISSSRMDMGGGRIDNALLKNYAETLVGGTGGVNTGASYTVDISTGNAFYLVLNNTPVTLTFSNPSASGTECSFTLLLKQDTTGGRTVTWPASVKWPGGRTPVISTAPGKVNVLSFSSPDNGTTWFGMPSGAEFTPGVGFPLFGWGFPIGTGGGALGQVGDNTGLFRSSPVQVGNTSNWASVAAGLSFTMAIDRTGALWGWGGNSTGQLAKNDVTARSSPTQIGTFTNWNSVRAVNRSIHGVDASGKLWGWGYNGSGRIGDGTIVNKSSPVQVGTLANWASVGANSPNGGHAMALNTSGQLFAWGVGTSGQLGQVTNATTMSSPVQVGTLTNWSTSFTTGASFTHAIQTNGTLWAWGYNGYAQLGDRTVTSRSSPVQIGTLTNWAKVAASASGSNSIKTDGTLWGWGKNSFNEVGDGSFIRQSSPIQVGTLTNWSNVFPGASHVMATKTDGSLWGWGAGWKGQLGLAIPPNVSSPVQIGISANWASVATGPSHTSAVKSDGTLWTWGLNSAGQLGNNNGAIPFTSSPVQVGTLTNWSKTAQGTSHTVAIKTDGTLWAWGLNYNGQLGINSATTKSSPVQIGTLTNWVFVTASAGSSFAINTNHALWAWGGNSGVLGINNVTSVSSPVQVGTLNNWAVVSSTLWNNPRAQAIKTDGTLWGWGYAVGGTIGDNNGTNHNFSSPVQIGTLTNWANLSVANWSNVQTGNTVATKTDGTLWVWGIAGGYNSIGAIGDNTGNVRSSPVQIGTLTNWALPLASGGVNFATKTDGTMWAWGNNVYGKVGDNTNISRSSPTQIGTQTNWPQAVGSASAQGGVNTLVVKTDGTLWGWGYRGLGMLGDNLTSIAVSPIQIGTLTSWTSAAGGSTHSMGLQAE